MTPSETAKNRYNLSESEIKALNLTVVIPFILIWSAAVYGYKCMRAYSEKIIASKDGKALVQITDGLLILALWLPISAVVSSASRYAYRNNPDLTSTLVIITNYVNLILVLAAFYVIYLGAKKLPGLLKDYNKGLSSQTIFWPIFAVVSAGFAYLTLTNPARQYPTDKVEFATYYLPDWLIVTTIVIPYIFVLYFGMRSVAHIFNFARKAPGTIYKAALRYIATGILLSVISLMTLRMLGSLTAWFEKQDLKAILAILYLLLILIGAGYVFIAKGAKKLQKIEEVK